MANRSSLQTVVLLFGWLCAISVALAETPTVNGDPVSADNGVMRFAIQGEFRPSIPSARESALQTAQERIRDWLSKQNPPIRRVPSLDTIKREMVRHEDPPQQEQILNRKDNMYKINMVVDLSPKQVRELRVRERVATGMWTLGGLLAMLGIAAFLFRVDEWTKGYLTRWLIAIGIAAMAILFAGWWVVR